ncbi:MAG: peptidoglycan-binding protein [Actinomycetota bacterium]|nr:peptidoglycan-binding protein [Actinomycetota bacterium]
MKAVTRGHRGLAVSDVQKRLADLGFSPPGFEAEVREAYYGETTVRAVREFQEKRGLHANGSVDETTWQELVEASFSLGDRFLYLRIPPFRGDDVREIQSYLNRLGFNAGREDGIFGQDTDRALRAFQHNMGLPVDGIAGSSTIACMMRLRHALKDTSVAEVHEALQDQAVRGLEGRCVILDAAEGDAGAERLLRATSDELLVQGVSAMITGGASGPISESQRARLANDRDFDLVLSLRPSPREGFRFYFFGTASYSSPRGRRLAEILHREIGALVEASLAEPEMKSYPLLRETRMPCVIVESPQDFGLTSGLALCLARAVTGYFNPTGEDGAPS